MLFKKIRIDITPDFPCFQAGYAAKFHKFTGVHDPIYLTIYNLEFGRNRLFLCSFDLCTLDHDCIQYFRKITRHLGIEDKEIMFTCTHTHHAPVISRNPIFIGDPTKYREFVGRKLKLTLRKLIKMHEGEYCNVYYSESPSKIGINRRNKGKREPNDSAYCDDMIQNLWFYSEDDSENLGNISKVTSHPSILGPENYKISAGFMKKSYDEEIYLQGCCGDVKCRCLVEGDKFKYGDFEDIEKVNRELSE